MSPEGRAGGLVQAKQVAFADRTDGDIDTLANRIASYPHLDVRVEPRRLAEGSCPLAGAHTLHRGQPVRRAARMPGRSASATVRRVHPAKGLRDKEEPTAEIADDGAIHVESHYVGRPSGFRFLARITRAEGIHDKAARHAAAQVLSRELGKVSPQVAAAKGRCVQAVSCRPRAVARRGDRRPRARRRSSQAEHLATLGGRAPRSASTARRSRPGLRRRDEIIADKLKPLADVAGPRT